MKLRIVFGIVAAGAIAVAGWNYVGAYQPVSAKLAQDQRNEKVSIWAYHQYGLTPSVLVIDLRKIDPSVAPLDVFRVLFHSAEALKGKSFQRVVLSYRGTPKFFVDGDFYQQLGKGFQTENPVYTMRTFPQNVRKMDGSPAFETWTGGMLGVLTNQMEDVAKFSRDWYLADVIGTAGAPIAPKP